MTKQEQNKINWLASAMNLPIVYRDEVCYYAKQLNLMGAIAGNDHLLLEEDFKTKYTTQYTDLEIELLTGLFQQFDNNQQDFVAIPRISNDERVRIQMEFMATHQDLSDFNVLVDYITSQDDNTAFILLHLFCNESHLEYLLDDWQVHMNRAMLIKINDFLKLWEIDLSTVEVWDIDFSRRAIVDLPNQTPIAQTSVKKPFWKIW